MAAAAEQERVGVARGRGALLVDGMAVPEQREDIPRAGRAGVALAPERKEKTGADVVAVPGDRCLVIRVRMAFQIRRRLGFSDSGQHRPPRALLCMCFVAAQIERQEEVGVIFLVSGVSVLAPIGQNPELGVGPVFSRIFGRRGFGLVLVEQEWEQVGIVLVGCGLGLGGVSPAAEQEKVVG